MSASSVSHNVLICAVVFPVTVDLPVTWTDIITIPSEEVMKQMSLPPVWMSL